MDYRIKPFAELYLDVLCDDMDAAIEFKRRLEKGDGVPQASKEAVNAFFDCFTTISRWPMDLFRTLNDVYFSKLEEEIPIEMVQKYPLYDENAPYNHDPYDNDSMEHMPKRVGSPAYHYWHLRWLMSFVADYDLYPLDKKHGRDPSFPRFAVAWGIECALRQNDKQTKRDALLTRAFHKFHPEYFKKLGLTPIYEKDGKGAYEDICEFLNLLGKKGPMNIGYHGDFWASRLSWYNDDSHKPYLPNEIVGEILYSQGDARWEEFISEKTLKSLPGNKAPKSLKNPVLKFTGDGYYCGNKEIEIDGKWYSLSDDASIRVVALKDETYLVDYRNSYYKNSPLSFNLESFASNKTNWDDSTKEEKTGSLTLRPNEEQELGLFYPRYEHATGFTNNLCSCKFVVVEKK